MIRIILAAAMLFTANAASAATASTTTQGGDGGGSSAAFRSRIDKQSKAGEVNLKIEVRVRHEKSESSVEIMTLNAVQSNYVRKNPKEKLVFIVNLLPVLTGKNAVDMQFQVEFSDIGSGNRVYQVQSEAAIPLGKWTVVNRSSAAQLSFKITRID